MAIACLRLVTVFPDPLFSVPRFRLFMALFTVSCAFLPYFAITYYFDSGHNCKKMMPIMKNEIAALITEKTNRFFGINAPAISQALGA
jgi:hypothetical protein